MTQLARQEGQPLPQAPAAPFTYIDDCVTNIGHWEDKVKRDVETLFLRQDDVWDARITRVGDSIKEHIDNVDQRPKVKMDALGQRLETLRGRFDEQERLMRDIRALTHNTTAVTKNGLLRRMHMGITPILVLKPDLSELEPHPRVPRTMGDAWSLGQQAKGLVGTTSRKCTGAGFGTSFLILIKITP